MRRIFCVALSLQVAVHGKPHGPAKPRLQRPPCRGLLFLASQSARDTKPLNRRTLGGPSGTQRAIPLNALHPSKGT